MFVSYKLHQLAGLFDELCSNFLFLIIFLFEGVNTCFLLRLKKFAKISLKTFLIRHVVNWLLP